MPSCEKWAYPRFFCSAERRWRMTTTDLADAARRAARAGGRSARFRARGGRAVGGGRRTRSSASSSTARAASIIDAIGSANRWVSELLDEADPITRRTCSRSPRRASTVRCVKRADFDRFAGETVTHEDDAGRETRHLHRRSSSASKATTSIVDVDGERVCVPYDDIQKARLKGVVDFGNERGQLRARISTLMQALRLLAQRRTSTSF